MRMVLKMIAKKVAGNKSPHMVSTLTSGLLFVIRRMFTSVGEVGPKNE
jgi:hypothetical protein